MSTMAGPTDHCATGACPTRWRFRVETRKGATSSSNGTTPLHLVLAWGFVGIPLAWGVIETVMNAMKLFW